MKIELEEQIQADRPQPSEAAGVIDEASQAVVAQAIPFHKRHMLYEDKLVWFVLLSSLDIICTWMVLRLGGVEVNAIARFFLNLGDLYGLIVFKFVMVIGIILLCDYVGRRNDSRGRFIANAAVAITSVPVILALAQIFRFVHL